MPTTLERERDTSGLKWYQGLDRYCWIVLAIGFVVSFIVALGVVEWFLQWVRRHGLVLFAVYRIVLAILLLTLGKTLLGM